jgi:hypothetical protein
VNSFAGRQAKKRYLQNASPFRNGIGASYNVCHPGWRRFHLGGKKPLASSPSKIYAAVPERVRSGPVGPCFFLDTPEEAPGCKRFPECCSTPDSVPGLVDKGSGFASDFGADLVTSSAIELIRNRHIPSFQRIAQA